MKRNSITATILASLVLLTACGAVGRTGTATTSDYNANITVDTEIQDLGTEEYIITDMESASTNEEKQMKYILYLQEVLANDITKAYPAIKDADVTLIKAEESDVNISEALQTMQVEICLDLEEELAEDSIVKIAEAAANAVDSETDNVTIQNADGKILYIRSEALPEDEI